MSSSIYTPWVVTVGEQPTTAYWNILGSNDASFNTGQGFNDNIITWRHLATDIIPTGSLQPFAGASSPSAQWLVCDGSAVSRATYSALFNVCGTAYGAGNGSTTFNLPLLAGRVPAGVLTGDGNFGVLGQLSGEAAHVLSYDEMPVHSHGVYDPGHGHGLTRDVAQTSGGNQRLQINGGGQAFDFGGSPIAGNGSNIGIYNAGSGWGHNNVQPTIAINYLIKT